ncbi:MAG: glycogen/starch synthase [Woeseiaceae bacterium]
MASENGALPGGKVGGVGDVVRDLPAAIAAQGWSARVATPSYGSLHRLEGAERLGTVDVEFRNSVETVEAWRVPGSKPAVENIVFEHPLFAAGGPGRIYFGDEPARPFATDANKFALFSAAAAAWAGLREHRPDVVHLHDWHAALYLLFARFDPRFAMLGSIPTLFTIHNLSYQGTRPLRGDDSSLDAWFPQLRPDIDAIVDPEHGNCINPMATAIRLADRISTVSATYADEICRPSDTSIGFIGGEGLEDLLADARDADRLVGILNGCEYDLPRARRPGWIRLLGMLEAQLHDWQANDPGNEAHPLALQRLAAMPKRKPLHILTSIGRLVAQKATLLLLEADQGTPPLKRLAAELGRTAVIIVLGSGEPEFERRLLGVAQDCPNILYLNGYSELLADPLYAAGNLFLMPSSFEPCGISQMLAMRAGQPCVVHGVGGLRDTVEHGETGFVFTGETPREQAANFVAATLSALALRTADPDGWNTICDRARAQRFSWALAAQRTIEELYGYKDD